MKPLWSCRESLRMRKDWKFSVCRLHYPGCCICSWAWLKTQKSGGGFASRNTCLNTAVCILWFECSMWCWCARTYLTVRLLPVVIHSIVAACVPQSVIEELIVCLLLFMPCSRQFNAIEGTQDVATFDTPALQRIRGLTGGHLFRHCI